MLWILARFREICIRAFYARILIAMAELFFQPDVPVVVMLFNLDRAFRAIRIMFANFRHETLDCDPSHIVAMQKQDLSS